jgi:hypothetical protein
MGGFEQLRRENERIYAAASFREFLLKSQPSLPVDVFDALRANQVWDLQRLLRIVKEACPSFYYEKHAPLKLTGQRVLRQVWADYLRGTTPPIPSQID